MSLNNTWQIHVSDTVEAVYENAAQWIAGEIRTAVKARGTCFLALSGGKTPENIYQLLATASYRESIPWHAVHFFWGDERMVPFDDEQNNAKMAFAALLDHIDVPPANIHRMPSMAEPAAAVIEYDELLHQYFSKANPFSFDIVLLGMGDDGHTLSLFPQSELLSNEQSWVNTVYVEKFRQYRLTLMPAIVNKARAVAFIVTGTTKAPAFNSVLNGKMDPENYPAQLIRPASENLHWFIDKSVTVA